MSESEPSKHWDAIADLLGAAPPPEPSVAYEASLPRGRGDAPASRPEASAPTVAGAEAGARIHTFESEIDPFEMSRLDSGHLVLFRKVWREGARYIQGALIDQAP